MPSLRGLDPDVCEAIDVLMELLKWKKGTCSAKVLHEHLCRSYDSSVVNAMGKSPYCLAEFLDDMPDIFTVSKDESGEWIVSLLESDSEKRDRYDDEEDDGPPPLERLPLDDESENIVASAVDYLKEILKRKGPCSSTVLHGHLGQDFGKVATDLMGVSPGGLAEFLMTMPEDFTVKFQPGGKYVVYLAGRASPDLKDLRLEDVVKSKNGIKLENGVKSGNNVKSENGVKLENGVKSGNTVKSENGVKLENGVMSRNGIKSGTGVKSENDAKLKNGFKTEKYKWENRDCFDKWNGSAEHEEVSSLDTSDQDTTADSLDFIVQQLEKRDSPMSLDKLLFWIFSFARGNIRKCLGTTAPQIRKFLSKYPDMFLITADNYVYLVVENYSYGLTSERDKSNPDSVGGRVKPDPCPFSRTLSKIANGSCGPGTRGSPKCANGNFKPDPFPSSRMTPKNAKSGPVSRQAAIDFIVLKLKTASHHLRAKDLLSAMRQEVPKLMDVVGPGCKNFQRFLGLHYNLFHYDDRGHVILNEKSQVHAATSNGIVGRNVFSPVPNPSPLPVHNSPLLPMFHRGPVLQLARSWGIIQRGTMFCDYIDFDAASLCADGETSRIWKELNLGDEVDCLIVHSDLKSSCGFRALKVWKVNSEGKNLRTAELLETPVICGFAIVTCCEGDAGYMRWTNGPLPGGDGEADVHVPDLLVYHQKFSGLPPTHRLSVGDSVKFAAIAFPKIWDKYKLWNCLRIWPQSLMRPPILDKCVKGMYDVPVVLDNVTADGGLLISSELKDSLAFRWDTIVFQKLSEFMVRQKCIATVLESSDSPHVIRRTVTRLIPKEYEATSGIVQVATAECVRGIPEYVRGSPLHFGTGVPSCDGSAETMKGRGCIISTNPHGGVLQTAEGAIVTFGPHCAFLKGAPVCHSYFGEGVEVNFEAVVGKVISTATKIWQ